jgi:hypothetical protein
VVGGGRADLSDGHVLEVPPCVRVDIGTSEVLGIARPNWQFHPDPEP